MSNASDVTPDIQFDSPWKSAIETYFPDFMAFFFPQIHADIDWSRGFEFLDKELEQVVRDAELGKRLADKLAKVWRLSGEESWVLAHLEVQNAEESVFPKRMYVYNYRLSDRYDIPVASLAILGDERSSWRPDRYQSELWGCAVDFRFPVVKLVDYKQNWQALEESRNPFAVVVMAHLKAQETRKDNQQRKLWKFTLTRRLHEQGYERQDILNLYRFIDWLLELPEGLELEFQQEIAQFEQERQMTYISSIERVAEQKGRQEEGRSLVLRQLNRRVGTLSEAVQTQVTALPLEQLEALGEDLLDFTSLTDLQNWLAR
jgi:Domain of unknown function (DUF4351)